MSTKKESAPIQVQKGKTTSQNEQVQKALPNSKKELTKEELQKKVEDLQKQLSGIPQNLNERIEYFNRKKELIRKLSGLDVNKETLSKHLDRLSEIAAEDEFDNEEYYLNIEAPNGYSKQAIYTLKNPVIIGEMISFILGRIDAKRQELQKEIEA